MRPLIIVNHRPRTPRAPRRPPALPVFLNAIIPLRGHRQSQPRMTTTERGLRARKIITLFTQGAKTSITPQLPPRHLTSLPSCRPPPHPHCQALHVSRTLHPTALPLPTPSVETVHLPTVLLAQISPILPAVVSPRVPRILRQALFHRQSPDFPSPSIGRSSLQLDNNPSSSFNLLGRARHVGSQCRGHLSGLSERCFISIASSVWYAPDSSSPFAVSDRIFVPGLRRRSSLQILPHRGS